MSFDEKRAWIMAVVSACTYVGYVSIILGRAGHRPLAEVPYASTLLWSIAAAIVAMIVLNIAAAIGPRGGDRKDQRDREIHRLGDYIGQSFVVIGGVAALGMALAEWRYFWIANVIYLGFVLSSLLSSGVKIAAYRWGFQGW
jgi:hypothetical protein